MSQRIERGIIKACAGIVESANSEPYVTAIKQAELVIGQDYSPAAESERQRLIDAIEMNLINQKEFPFEWLRRKQELSIGKNQFMREKYKFCAELSRILGL